MIPLFTHLNFRWTVPLTTHEKDDYSGRRIRLNILARKSKFGLLLKMRALLNFSRMQGFEPVKQLSLLGELLI